MPSLTVESFLNLLQKSNLLSAGQLAEVRQDAERELRSEEAPAGARSAVRQQAATVRPAQIAKRLVEQGLLTRWQADMLLAGRKAFFLGKYKLLDHIGVGGMGVVFKAQHATLGRLVALKLMAASLINSRAALARFHREIQAAAVLNHPNIVVAYDAVSVGDTHFLVMEYVDGHDLGFLLNRDGPLPIGWACECLRQTACGLQHAYEQGMVHRDIKPTNLLVTSDPESGGPLVKILDMGLARFVSEGTDEGGLTQTGQVLGTPDYISPEQAADTHAADIRSDIFSMGCTLFRLLTGNVPFGGRNIMEKLMSRAMSDAPLVRTQRPEVPAALEAVLAKMLARDPGQRYQTPAEVAVALAPFARQLPPSGAPANRPSAVAATGVPSPAVPEPAPELVEQGLEEFLRHLATEAAGDTPAGAVSSEPAGRVNGSIPASAQPAGEIEGKSAGLPGRAGQGAVRPQAVTPVPVPQRKLQGRRRLIGTIAATACAAMLIGSILLWQRLGATQLAVHWPASEREEAQLEIDHRRISIASVNGDTIYHSGKSGMWHVRATREGYEPIDETLLFHRGEKKTWQPEWKPTPRTARQRELAGFRLRLPTVAASDVDASLAVAWRGEVVEFLHMHQGTAEAQAAANLLPAVTWPLDRLASAQIPPYELQAAGNGDALRAPRELVGILGDSRLKQWNSVYSVASSADGRLIASAGQDGTVKLWDLATGNERQTLLVGGRQVQTLFSPVGSMLATTGDSRGVILWDAVQGTLHRQLAGAGGPIAFSADGALLVTQQRPRGIAVWNVASGQTRPSPAYSGKPLRSFVFSGDRKLLASYGSDNTIRLWDVASGAERRAIPHAHWPLFSPDSQLLAAGTAHGTLTLWSASTGKVERTLDEAGDPVAFSTDGLKLLSHRNGRVLLWNLKTGDEERTFRDMTGIRAISPDRQWLAAGDDNFGGLNFWTAADAAMHPAAGHPRAITCLAFTSDSATLVTGSADHTIKLWHPATGAERLLVGSGVGPGDLSPDGRMLAFATEDGSVKLWDVATQSTVRRLEGEARGMHSLAYSPDGKLIAGIGDLGFFKMALRLWDAANGRELTLHGDAPGSIRTLAFSADSRLLATAGDGRTVILWDAATRTIERTLEEHADKVRALAFSPNGGLLAVATEDRSIKVWDLMHDRERTLTSKGGDDVSALAFSPDGKTLAAGSVRNRVQIWDLAQGTLHRVLSAPGLSVNSLRFSLDGHLLAAANSAGKVHLWNLPLAGLGLREPDRTLAIGPSGGIVRQAALSPDGRHVLTVNGNGTIYVLRLHEFSAETADTAAGEGE